MQLQKKGRIRFGSPQGLSEESLAALEKALARKPERSDEPLEGRGGAQALELPSIGRVFIKHYLRGGFLRHFIDRGHLWNTRSRSQREFQALHELRTAGVSTPKPLAWAETGGLWVHCWLVMREAPAGWPYTTVIRESPDTAKALMPKIVQQVRLLLDQQYHHTDFHPGNILVGSAGDVLLIDFDKTLRRQESTTKLASRYVERWHRAVAKHSLPQFVSDLFEKLLNENLKRPQKPA